MKRLLMLVCCVACSSLMLVGCETSNEATMPKDIAPKGTAEIGGHGPAVGGARPAQDTTSAARGSVKGE